MIVRTIDALTGEVTEEEQDDSLFDATQSEAAIARNKRNFLLEKSDWTQLPNSPADSELWEAYRQALRDLPSHSDWPNVDFPNPPET